MSEQAADSYSRDEEHLRLLFIFHYVLAGIFAFFALIPIIHLTIGIAILANPESFEGAETTAESAEMAQFVGLLFTLIGGAIIFLGMLHAGLTAWSGRCLQLRKWRTFSLVVAGLNCLAVPFGTVLGVFTIVVLERPGIRALYPPPRRRS